MLRRLLVLARDYLQAPDQAAVLMHAGGAIPELLRADGALLLVLIGGQEYHMEFDRRGAIVPAQANSALLDHARQALLGQAPLVLPAMSTNSAPYVAASFVAYPFPLARPLGALVVRWSREQSADKLSDRLSTLRYWGELTGAALGNAGLRQSLQAKVATQSRAIETAASEHAGELQRRDDVEEEIRQISETDVLTGLMNRRGFFLQAEQSFKLARRLALPSALLFFDIDGLKQVNDRFGHDAGDRLIEDVARILRQSFRDSDVLARLGGDEFAAFTLDATEPEAIVKRIERNIEKNSALSTSAYPVSFSTGIVQCDPKSELSLVDYLSLADRRMYEHKGRKAGEPPFR